MPIVTTKSLGIGASEADPKPATGIDYAGQPMKPGQPYNGRPEHMGNAPGSPPASRKPDRATLLARLAKGRATAAANRRAKSGA